MLLFFQWLQVNPESYEAINTIIEFWDFGEQKKAKYALSKIGKK